MKPRMGIYFLFMEKIPLERLKWICQCFSEITEILKFGGREKETKVKIDKVKFFLSNDALFSLIDRRYQKNWKYLIDTPFIDCILDSEELNLLGFDIDSIINQHPKILVNNTGNHVENQFKEGRINFWDDLINSIHAQNFNERLGFLEFRGPYMSRTSVKMLRLLEEAIKKQLHPQLFTYLDGIHIGHLEQRPSEFENIGKGLLSLKEKVKEHNLDFIMLSCSRCGTARGYIRNDQNKDYKQSDDAISGYLFCNLNRIIDYYEDEGLILAPSWGSVQFLDESFLSSDYETGDLKEKGWEKDNVQTKPPLVIFITHSPYGSEWTFGGISFAMACANHGITTKVVFIEDGIYCIHGTHNVRDEDKIFNIQEIIIATHDMKDLKYYVFKGSLEKRNLAVSSTFEVIIEKITAKELGKLIISRNHPMVKNKRILFF